MLSRVAESLYWISRYIERTDGMLRMLKINYAASQDSITEFSWAPVIKIFCGPDPEGISDEFNSRNILQFMVTNRDNPNSIVNIITQVRENARSNPAQTGGATANTQLLIESPPAALAIE